MEPKSGASSAPLPFGVDDDTRFFNLSLDMLCIVSFDGFFQEVNSVWSTVTGYSIKELKQRPFLTFFHPDDQEQATAVTSRLIDDQAPLLGIENRFQTRDGAYRWLRWNATGGRADRCFYAVARDVTEEKEIEAAQAKLITEQAHFSTALRTLHRLSTSQYQDFQSRYEDHLAAGCDILNLPTGIISMIDGETYTVKAFQGGFDISPGTIFELADTYCSAVVKEQQTVAYAQVGLLPDMLGHPVYQNLKLESYISAPIMVSGSIYGTINFSSTVPRPVGFKPHEREIVELMAQSIGRAIELQQESDARRLVTQRLQDLALFSELNPAPVISVDRAGNILSANLATRTLFVSEAGSASAEAVLPPELAEVDFGALIDQARLVEMTIPLDDRFYYLFIQGVPEADIAQIYGTDITQVKNAEAAARQREKMFRTLLETAAVAIVMIDTDGFIRLVNGATESMFGYDRATLHGQSIEMLLPDRVRDRHRGHRTTFFNKPQPRAMGAGSQLFGLRKGGIEFPVDVSLSAIQMDEGVMALAFVIDITDRREAEQRIERQAIALSRSNTELGQFAYVISHDLRAPLRALKTYSTFLQEDLADTLGGDELDSLEGIAENAQQMESLIVDLLTYARIGRVKQTITTVNFEDLLLSIVKRLRLDDEAEINLPSNLPVVTGSPVRLDQIFTNLLSNATKFRRPNVRPEITVSVTENDDAWTFAVADNGIGIDETHQNKIFGVFQRLHTQEAFEGTGIGLAIVKKAVTEHGGKVQVRSQPGVGATFSFTLPKGEAHMIRQLTAADDPAATGDF